MDCKYANAIMASGLFGLNISSRPNMKNSFGQKIPKRFGGRITNPMERACWILQGEQMLAQSYCTICKRRTKGFPDIMIDLKKINLRLIRNGFVQVMDLTG